MNIPTWQSLWMYNDLIYDLEELPGPNTDEAWEERQKIHRWLLERRKVVADKAYEEYLKHDRKPWCDECGKPVVFREFGGWYHVDEIPRLSDHSVEVHEYSAGCEAGIIKRLKFEI